MELSNDLRIKARLLRWGNSFGLRLRKEDVKRLGMKTGRETIIHIPRERTREELRVMFGSLKGLKRSTREMLKEIDEGW